MVVYEFAVSIAFIGVFLWLIWPKPKVRVRVDERSLPLERLIRLAEGQERVIPRENRVLVVPRDPVRLTGFSYLLLLSGFLLIVVLGSLVLYSASLAHSMVSIIGLFVLIVFLFLRYCPRKYRSWVFRCSVSMILLTLMLGHLHIAESPPPAEYANVSGNVSRGLDSVHRFQGYILDGGRRLLENYTMR
jgi:hypothetical protein